MSLIDVAPVVLVAGKTSNVDLGRRAGIPPNACEVKLQNESALTLLARIGDDAHRLGAWMVDVFPLRGARSMFLDPSQIQSPAPAGIPSSLVLITVATEGDRIPGTYPSALARVITQNPIPNQPPLMADVSALASATATWLIPPVAGVAITVFDIVPTYVTGTTLQYIFGYGTSLPGGSPSGPNRLLVSGNSGAFLYEYHGTLLPRGAGIWVWNNSVNQLDQLSTLFNYSLS